MNDAELIMALREQRGKVPMTAPLEQIISRGRAVRARRRVALAVVPVGAAAAVAAAVALSAGHVALPGGHPAAGRTPAGRPAASHPAGGAAVQLAAWTVTRQAGGTIQVTFRQAADAAGLQRTLRADGVPVSVTFTGQLNPACQPYPASRIPAFWPYGPKAGPVSMHEFITDPKDAYSARDALVIDPSALPSGAGLQISTSGTSAAADNFRLNVMFVRASPQCTGS
jgi:hypothetical protein